jgi:hypothetical protein
MTENGPVVPAAHGSITGPRELRIEGGMFAMKTLVGGAIAAVLGIVGIIVLHDCFFTVLGGVIPIMLLLGGALAFYLGFDELKDSMKKEDTTSPSVENEDVNQYKKEIDDLKKEIEDLKSEKA